MTWDILPIELRVLILSKRHIMRKKAKETILRYWKKFQAPKQVACDLVLEERSGLPMSVFHIETVRIMKYCKKVLSGREDQIFWHAILEELDNELWEYKEHDNYYFPNESLCYDIIKYNYFELARIFGYEKKMCID